MKDTIPTAPLGFLGAMTLLFIGLKLTGHIDWSWWLVLCPHGSLVAIRILIALGEWGERERGKARR